MMKKIEETGMQKLRAVVSYFDRCRESFNDRFTPAQLVKLHDAAMASEWDIYADQWSERQLREALRGIAPAWTDEGEPLHKPAVLRGGRRCLKLVGEAIGCSTQYLVNHGISEETIERLVESGQLARSSASHKPLADLIELPEEPS